MRVNPEVYTKRLDMNNEVRIPNCEPAQLKTVAERLMQMVMGLDYDTGDYHTMTELDKKLMVDYWKTYDNLLDCLSKITYGFDEWFVMCATEPELIRRARQWLVAHRYLILKSDVVEHAQEAGVKFRAVKGK